MPEISELRRNRHDSGSLIAIYKRKNFFDKVKAPPIFAEGALFKL